MHPDWLVNPKYSPEALGFIPYWLDIEDGRSAVDQIHDNYAHGGGWRDFEGFTLDRKYPDIITTWRLKYPGDPRILPVGYTALNKEIVVVWPYSWVTVHNEETGTFRCARID